MTGLWRTMSGNRQRRCRICRKRPVWRGGDVNDARGTCKRYYHAFVWPDRPQAMRGRTTKMASATALTALWELGMQLEIERLSQEGDSGDATP